MDKYEIFEIIGDGTYGTVYKGLNKITNEKVAIKKLKDKIKSWNECMEQNEVRILKKLSHQNIVKLNEVIREQNSEVSFIFEYGGINLYEFIEEYRKRKEVIPEFKIRNIIYQIINGLNYLHLNGFIHRDLKPENILIIENTNEVKIADFGVAKELPKYKNQPLTDYVCTRWYRSPECVLKTINYNSSIDVWAVGCIMVELYNLKPIFPGMDEFDQLNKIVNILGTPNFNEWPEGYKLIQKLGMKFPVSGKKDLNNIVIGACPEAIRMLNDIFQYDSKNRPSAGELLNYGYFNDLRPGTFQFQSRYKINERNIEKNFDNNFIRANINNNNFSNLSGNYSFGNLQNNIDNIYPLNLYNNLNETELEKNNRDYIRNLNYKDYRSNENVIPEINSAFNKNNYQFKLNNNNSNNVFNQYNSNYNKNKFSSLAQNNIFFENKKKFPGNFYNGFSNNNIYSKYRGLNNYNTNYGDNFSNKQTLGRIYNYGTFLYN